MILMLIFCLCCSFKRPDNWQKVQINGYAQGTTYHITYYAKDTLAGSRTIDSILNSIDSSLSIYKPYSLISRFNQSEKGIKINQHFKNVVVKSLEVYQNTRGLFDITVLPLMQAWGFGTAKTTPSFPDTATIQGLLPCIGSDKISLEGDFLRKKLPCIKVDINGIAQGYSVDVIALHLEQLGIHNYLVEIGGEIKIKGRKMPEQVLMTVGIEKPQDDLFKEESIQQRIYIEEGAVTTSGNYKKYYESNGKKITHLLNPLTGYTVMNDLISVTVVAKDAITADGYDNAFMAMGLQKALVFAESRKELSAYFIYKDNMGNLRDTASNRFYKLMNTN